MVKYFYTDGKKKIGPFSKEELKNLNISRGTKIWCYGMDSWKKLSDLPELKDILKTLPPEIEIKFTLKNSINNTELNPVSNQTEKSEKKEKLLSTTKWLMGIVILIVMSFFIYSISQNQSEVILHKEIVANSYDANEEFDMYIDKFYRDLEFYGIYPKKPKSTIIKFSRLDQIDNTTHIHGLSFGVNNDNIIEIYINPSTWKKFNKPMRYFLMYHELAHDVLNLDDLEAKIENKGKLMYPEIAGYDNLNMDEFIESFHALFEEFSMK